jgi:hypothetical protein
LRKFTFVVHDDRFDAPFSAYVTCRDAERALEIAKQKFSDTPYITLIDVSDGVESFSVPTRNGTEAAQASLPNC